MVEGLRSLPSTRLDGLPRMADFALWATACESALWPAGTFRSAYQGNREEAVDNVIEADPVALAIRQLMSERQNWTGTATDLLKALVEIVGEKVANTKDWPKTPRVLSGCITRTAPFLRRIGTDIERFKIGRSRARTIHITTHTSGEPEREGDPSSAPSASSALILEAKQTGAPGSSFLPTLNVAADDEQRPQGIVRAEVPETAAADDADDADDDSRAHSKSEEKSGRPLEGGCIGAAATVTAAVAAGVRMKLDGGRLVLSTTKRPDDLLVEEIRSKTPEIVDYLRGLASWTEDDWHALFNERAGIIEFDGGQSRAEAEAQAKMEVEALRELVGIGPAHSVHNSNKRLDGAGRENVTGADRKALASLGDDEDLAIPEFLDRAKHPRPGDPL